MNISEDEYALIESDRKHYEQTMHKAKVLHRLYNNPDFNELIVNGLLNTDLRYYSIEWAKTNSTEYQNKMQCLLMLQLLLDDIDKQASMAEKSLNDLKHYLDTTED